MAQQPQWLSRIVIGRSGAVGAARGASSPDTLATVDPDMSESLVGTAAVGRASTASPARHTVSVRSTVPSGTTEETVRSALEQSDTTAGTGFGPVPGPCSTVIDSRVDRTLYRLQELLAPIGGTMRTFRNPAAAELTVPRYARDLPGRAVEIGVDMPLLRAVVGAGVSPATADVDAA